jgi:serine/threonine protein kinase
MNINSNEIIQINKPETQEKNNEPTVKKVTGCLRVLQTEPQVAEKTLKITETINGKGTRIAKGGFGKIYKILKYIDDNGNIKNISPFAQKQTHIFDSSGNIIGQNLKEVSLGYKYLNNENTQKFHYVIIDKKENVVDSKYIINMNIADMTFNDLIQTQDLTNEDRYIYFFPILKQLLNSITYINSNYICHGDIKPENILIYGDKKLYDDKRFKDYLNSATFQICDYSGVNMEYNITMDNISTLYYRPPEFFLKLDKKFKNSIKHTYGNFNDIWSIGITMLEFLTKSNIISKLYKKNTNISEKKFLTRFFNIMHSIDVSIVIKNSGYNINNYHIKNICNVIELMLIKNIEKRINVTNLNMFIDYFINKNLNFYIRYGLNKNILQKKINTNFIHYYNLIIQDNIILKFRDNAIRTLLDFLNNNGVYSNENDIQYLPLGLLLFDRYISIQNKTKHHSEHEKYSSQTHNHISLKFFYTKTLFICYYIASKYLLNNIDIVFICEFLNIDIDEIHIDILDILQQLDFDIYRPTILTFLNQQNEDIYHSKYIINNAIDFFCNSSYIQTDYSIAVSFINEFIEFEQKCFNSHQYELKLNNLQNNNLNDTDLNLNTDDLEIPKLKRNIY